MKNVKTFPKCDVSDEIAIKEHFYEIILDIFNANELDDMIYNYLCIDKTYSCE